MRSSYLFLRQPILLHQYAFQAPEVQAFDVPQLVVAIEVLPGIFSCDGFSGHLPQKLHEAGQVVFIPALKEQILVLLCQ